MNEPPGWRRLGGMKHIRSNVIGYVALFIALTIAPAWAASIGPRDIGRDAVRSKHIKSVKGADVVDGGLTGADVADGGLSRADIDGGVEPAGPAGGALSGSYPEPGVANGAVTADSLAPGAVTTGSIADGTIRAEDIDGSTLPSGSPTGAAGGDLTGDYPNPSIAGGAVGSGEIADFTIGTTDVGINALAPGNIQDNSLNENEIAANGVDSGELTTDSVQAPEIDAGAVGASEIGTGAAGSDEIGTAAVGSDELGTGAAGSDEIASNAVGSAEVAVDAVGTSEIATLPAVRATRTTDFAVPSGGSGNTVPLNSEQFDTGTLHSTAASTHLLTAPVSGIYQVTAQAGWDNQASSRSTYLDVVGPGGEVIASTKENGVVPGTQNATGLVSLGAGESVSMEVTNFGGAGNSIELVAFTNEPAAHLEMVWLGDG